MTSIKYNVLTALHVFEADRETEPVGQINYETRTILQLKNEGSKSCKNSRTELAKDFPFRTTFWSV